MSDSIQVKPLAPFSTINYVTKDGEHCTATKNNGVVTVVSDKNGVKQLPLDKFMKEFIESLPKKGLENSPSMDTVSFSGNEQAAETKTVESKPESEPIQSDNGKVSKGVIAAIATAGTALIGAGIYLLTKGKNKKAIQEVTQDVTDKVSSLTDDIAEKTKAAVTAAAEKVKEGTVKVQEAATEVKEKAAPIAMDIKEKTVKAAEEVKTKIQETAAEVKEKAAPKVAEVKEKVSQAAEEVKTKVQEAFDSLKPVKAEETTAEVLTPDKIEIPAKPPKSKGKSKKQTPKTIAVQEEVKPETAKYPAKPAEAPKQDDAAKLADLQKQQDEIFEKQQKAQKEAIEKQNQQIQDDTNNVIAATLLMDDAFAGGGKKVADAAKDVIENAAQKLDDGVNIADDLFKKSVADDTGKYPFFEKVIKNEKDNVKDVPGVEDLFSSKTDDIFAKHGEDILNEPVDLLNKDVDSFGTYKNDFDGLSHQIDDVLSDSYDALKSDFYSGLDDFNSHIDDIGGIDGGFDDFGIM